MRIVTLNLMHGGGGRVSDLADHIRGSRADVAVLTEFRATGPSQRLLDELADQFPYRHGNPPPRPADNGVAVISRRELQTERSTRALAGEAHRWAEVVLPSEGLRLVGLYVPGSGNTAASRASKIKVWEAMLGAAPAYATGKTVVIGDLNTGLHRIDETNATFTCAEQFEAFGSMLVDAWRSINGNAREFSWYSNTGNGFRIDHAFVSPPLVSAAPACRYDHAPRDTRATDHAMLLLDLAVR